MTLQIVKPFIAVVFGPTASGKTELAVQLALALNTEIISADSRQIYTELNIGVAKPTDSQLAAVPHHFINHVSIQQRYSAADFAGEGRELLHDIVSRTGCAVICGGTGLYIRALINGLDEQPRATEEILESIEKHEKETGLEGLKTWLLQLDSDAPLSVELNNPARVKRAIAMLHNSGGKTLKDFKTGVKSPLPWPNINFMLHFQREELYSRINLRVDAMMAEGLLREVTELMPYKNLPALNTVGYTELFDYLDGKMNLEQAVDKIKQHTRNYAKRQQTWFNNQETYIKTDNNNSFQSILKSLHEHGYIHH